MLAAIPDITANRARLCPDRIVFKQLHGEQQQTYLGLDRRARRAAGLLSSLGVAPADRVAVICRNRIEFFELLFACAKLGAVLVPLNWRLAGAELATLVRDCSPKVLIVGAEDESSLPALHDRACTVIKLDSENAGDYPAAIEAAHEFGGRAMWPCDDTWYLLYTSGTTGLPKAVTQTFGMAVSNYVNIRQAMGITGTDTTLNFLPLFHTAGINLVTLPTVFEGGEVLLLPGFEIETVVRLLAAGELDTMFAVPTVYSEISRHPRFTALDLSRVRAWGCGGAPISGELLSVYLQQGARICNGMGMTETGPTVFVMDPESVESKPGSVGKPQLLSSVRIVDADGHDVAAGGEGEIWFRGPGVTPGYWRNEKANAAAFSNDGWLKSGDIGLIDDDGYFYVVGRIKDMFISGGENVYPAEVENVLLQHPAVVDAAVLPAADEKWGEVGIAYIQWESGEPVPDAKTMQQYCRQHLARYKIPKYYKDVIEFPRTAAGKIQKHLLMEQ